MTLPKRLRPSGLPFARLNWYYSQAMPACWALEKCHCKKGCRADCAWQPFAIWVSTDGVQGNYLCNHRDILNLNRIPCVFVHRKIVRNADFLRRFALGRNRRQHTALLIQFALHARARIACANADFLLRKGIVFIVGDDNGAARNQVAVRRRFRHHRAGRVNICAVLIHRVLLAENSNRRLVVLVNGHNRIRAQAIALQLDGVLAAVIRERYADILRIFELRGFLQRRNAFFIRNPIVDLDLHCRARRQIKRGTDARAVRFIHILRLAGRERNNVHSRIRRLEIVN